MDSRRHVRFISGLRNFLFPSIVIVFVLVVVSFSLISSDCLSPQRRAERTKDRVIEASVIVVGIVENSAAFGGDSGLGSGILVVDVDASAADAVGRGGVEGALGPFAVPILVVMRSVCRGNKFGGGGGEAPRAFGG